MRGYFDEEKVERREKAGRDTEVTLGSGALAGIIFGLLVLCGLCFAFGNWMGERDSGRGQAPTQSLTQTAAPDEEPLQANGSIPKPSADAQLPAPAPAQAGDGSQAPAAAAGANPANPANAAAQPGPAPAGQASAPGTAAGAAQQQAQVRAALPATANAPQEAAGAASPNVQAALPSANQLMVQVAAVSHIEDADVLVNALRRHGYAATALRDPADGLIHVRIGPFTNREDAVHMARRLLDDGYNAMVQP